MELTSANVSETVKQCLFEVEPEDPSKAVLVKGVVAQFGFDPQRLKQKASDIVSMLEQLPSEFRKSGGGGYSFLAACNRADGVQWGEHRSMDELFCLGIAIGKVQSCFPFDMWSALPGGVPYYVVDL